MIARLASVPGHQLAYPCNTHIRLSMDWYRNSLGYRRRYYILLVGAILLTEQPSAWRLAPSLLQPPSL
ncbi:hypothetical protein ACFLT5_02395 [Chloroflexota bacterium]